MLQVPLIGIAFRLCAFNLRYMQAGVPVLLCPGAMMGDTKHTLERIAEALGVSVETFTGSFGTNDNEMLAELISLWVSIQRGADRNKVLACARSVIASQHRDQGVERR